MEHYKESQYDDDLTVGIDDYDEDFSSSGDHLFDFINDEESPLARLKSIVLSIDWEITDDILRQFNEELVQLKDVWRGEKINLIYIQALDKISRYIYKEKASAHPNAIKLLLTFYTNLEKIVSDDEMSDNDKKEILIGDVKRFEKFKSQILPGIQDRKVAAAQREEIAVASAQKEGENVFMTDMFADDDPLLNLKAVVYGIDWEITSHDLDNLAKEVAKLEKKYSNSKAKLIFLQGIGSLGAYISLKKSDAHVNAFTLLHSFYAGLEKVIIENLSGQAEKEVLFAEVEKFNEFKRIVEKTISRQNEKSDFEEEQYENGEDIRPAFSDMPEDVHGFQAEDEELETISGPGGLFDGQKEEFAESEGDSELAHEMESHLDNMFEEPGLDSVKGLDKNIALAGVDVETDADDDSDEEPLPLAGDELAPALSGGEIFEVSEDAPAAFSDYDDETFEDNGVDIVLSSDVEDAAAGVEDSSSVNVEPDTVAGFGEQDTASIPGVDVETDADDDSDEDPLPLQDGELAPALFDDEGSREGSQLSSYEDVESDVETFFTNPDATVSVETDDKADEDQVEEIDGAFAVVDDEPGEAVLQDEVEMEEETALIEADSAGQLAEQSVIQADEQTGVSSSEQDDELDEAIGNKIDDFFTEKDELITSSPEDDIFDDDVEEKLTSFFGETERPAHSEPDVALSGLDVERPDDDDSDEAELPMDGDDLAPALRYVDGSDAEVDLDDDQLSASDDVAEVVAEDVFDESAQPDLTDTSEEESQLAEMKLDQLSDEESQLPEMKLDQLSEEESQLPEMKLDQLSDDMMTALLASDEERVDDQTDETVAASLEKEVEEREIIFEAVDDEGEEDVPVSEDDIGENGVIFEAVDENIDENVITMQGGDSVVSAEEPASELSETETEEVVFVAADDAALEELTIVEVDGVAVSDEPIAVFSGDQAENTETDPALLEEIDSILLGSTPREQEVSSEAELLEDDAEVIFKAADDGDGDFDESQIFSTTLLQEESPLLGEKLDDLTTERFTDEISSTAHMDDQPEAVYISSAEDGILSSDMLSGLRNTIAKIENNEESDAITRLNGEIDFLRRRLINPMEKTYIQLLSTINEHIEKYSGQPDRESVSLFHSVFDKLELSLLDQNSAEEKQELLLAETSKVLQWQQRLIDRAPEFRANLIEESLDDTELTEQSLLGTAIDKTQMNVDTALDSMSAKVDELGDDLLMQKVSSVMKSELEGLKLSFQEEIQRLREEIMQGRE